MITPGAAASVVWPPSSSTPAEGHQAAQRREKEQADDVRAFFEASVNISRSCTSPDGGDGVALYKQCLHPGLVERLITGELEYLKRGRLERIFPPDPPTRAEAGESEEKGGEATLLVHPALIKGKANAAAAWWHRKIRRRAVRAGEGNTNKAEL